MDDNNDLESYKSHVTGFLDDTGAQTVNAQRRRDYIDNKQWTQEEESTLRGRKQAATVNNRLAPKVDGLKGLLIQRRTDPKAFPRTQAHEEAADAVTDGLRYVADNTHFDDTKLDVADDYFVEGYGGTVVRVKKKGDEPEITIDRVPWDRIYYDPHSRQHDFKDALYMGILTWMDLEEAKREHGQDIDLMSEGDGEFEDRPKWIDLSGNRKRIRVAEEFRKIDGIWHVATFTMGKFLKEPRPVPLVDEDGEPENPMELVACHIDRENQRYGDVEYWMDSQDAINHGLSKFRHFMSTRQLKVKNGAVEDIDALKREFKKPDGVLEYEGEGDDVEVLNTHDMAQAQMAMVEFSSGHIDSVGFNAQLAGERQGNLSGKAIALLSNNGTNELASSFGRLTQWENRVYRQVYNRIVQFWTAEKWIRVTDEERKLRWVGFNIPITREQILAETVNDESQPMELREGAKITLKQWTDNEDPRLQEPVETRNKVAELDMDIVLEQSLDTINIQQEQFTLLATLAGNRPEIPFTALLRLSTLREKDELIKKIEEGEANAGKAIEAQAKGEIAKAEALAKIDTEAEAQKIKLNMEKELVLNKQKITAQQEIKAAEIQADQQKAEISKGITEHAGSVKQAQVLEIPAAEAIQGAMNALAQSNQNVAQSNEAEADAMAAILAELQRPLTIERDESGRAVAVV